MEPINYNVDVATPFQSYLQGYQGGAAIRNDQQQQAALATQKVAQQQQQQIINGLISNPNASAEDYGKAVLLIPGMKDQLKQSYETRSADQQQAHVTDLSKYYAAIQSGQPQVAVDLMAKKADAMEAAGENPKMVQALRTQSELVKLHPEAARTMMGFMLASAPGGDKIITSANALNADRRAEDKAPADARAANAEATIKEAAAEVAPQTEQQKLEKGIWDNANTRSQIEERGKRLALDGDKLTSEVQLKLTELADKRGELPEPIRKDVDAAVVDTIAAQQSATKMLDLASRLEKEGGGYGAFSTAGEWLKKATGNQNEMTRIRAEYNRMVTPAAMAAYKQVAAGSTSDKDIETAMTGVPKDTADAALMASYLRGAAKLQQYDAVLNNAKSEWLGANRSLGKSKADGEIDGVKVPAGMSFKQFTDQYVQRKVGQITAQQVLDDLNKKYGGAPSGAGGQY